MHCGGVDEITCLPVHYTNTHATLPSMYEALNETRISLKHAHREMAQFCVYKII